jgi:hypothetical protein
VLTAGSLRQQAGIAYRIPRATAGLFVALAATVAWACSPAPTARPVASSPAATSAATDAGPSPSVGAAPECTADELALELGGWEGAAGSRFVVLTARTLGDRSCTLSGRPAVALVDGNGEIIIDSISEPDGLPHVEPGDPTVVIGPDRGATVAIGTSNWCAATPPLPLGIVITLLNETTQGYTPGEGTAADLPPCNGPGQPPQIYVQSPWQPEL